MTGAGIGPEPDPRPTGVVSSFPAPPTCRKKAGLLCAGIALFNLIALVGDLCSPVLLPRRPMLVVMLSPRTAYLVATAHDVPFAVFLGVAVLRLCAVDPLHFMLGRTMGPAAIAAVCRIELVRRVIDRLPRTGAVWLVGIAGSPTAKTMCAAGAAGLPGRGAAAANVAGTVARVLIIWTAGRAVPGAGATMASVAPWIAVPGGVALVTTAAFRRFWRRAGSDDVLPAATTAAG